MAQSDAEREYARAYYQANRERLRAAQRRYYKANREANRERSRKWIAANHERWLAKSKAWRKANPEKFRGYQKKHALKKRLAEFGMTREQRSALFEDSDGLCAICYEKPAVHLDHDHETMEVRGALCRPCNTALGMFEDNPERLRYAADYIERYRKLIIKERVGT